MNHAILNRKACAVTALLLSWTLGLRAQSTPLSRGLQTHQAASAQQPVDEATILLDVAVRQKTGTLPASELKQSDFTVLDNKKPVTLSSFRVMHKGDEPVRVLIVLDTMNIPADWQESARTRLEQALRRNDGVLPVSTAVATFAGRGGMHTTAFTTSGNDLAQALQSKTDDIHSSGETGGGSGHGGGGSQRALMTLERMCLDAGDFHGRTLVLWLTPGWPLASGPELRLTPQQMDQLFHEIMAFTTELRRSRLTLYVLDPLDTDKWQSSTMSYAGYLSGVAKSSEAAPAYLGIQILAMHSGGWVQNSSDIAHGLDDVYADLNTYYQLRFPATQDKPNTLHTIHVKLDPHNLVARTVDEYYAQMR